MFWKKLRQYLCCIRTPFTSGSTSGKINTTLDATSIRIFGQEIKVTREIPVNGPPYELTVVVPRAEMRINQKTGTKEIILSSITIANSPRLEGKPQPAKITIPPPKTA